jgi:hypothetical protein
VSQCNGDKASKKAVSRMEQDDPVTFNKSVRMCRLKIPGEPPEFEGVGNPIEQDVMVQQNLGHFIETLTMRVGIMNFGDVMMVDRDEFTAFMETKKGKKDPLVVQRMWDDFNADIHHVVENRNTADARVQVHDIPRVRGFIARDGAKKVARRKALKDQMAIDNAMNDVAIRGELGAILGDAFADMGGRAFRNTGHRISSILGQTNDLSADFVMPNAPGVDPPSALQQEELVEVKKEDGDEKEVEVSSL